MSVTGRLRLASGRGHSRRRCWRICPGYRLADGGEPVARARRDKRRPR
ncbi:hypothetical protein AZ036_004960, partial [Klebsiella michiganensis]